MTTSQLYTLLQSNELEKVKEIFQLNYDVKVIQDAIKQYDPKQHDVFDKDIRKDRYVYEDSSVLDSEGNPVKKLVDIKYVPRIAVPFQRQITLLRSAFVGTPTMSSNPQQDIEKQLLEVLEKIWEDNKLDFKFSETKKRTMSELRCAWLYYNIEDKEYWQEKPITSNIRPRVKVLSHELGDALYPLYDSNDDLIAFARGYTEVSFDEQFNKIDVEHLDIYTNERFYFKQKVKGIWTDNFAEGIPLFSETNPETQVVTAYQQNIVGKIPVIYFSQPLSEWSDVQDAANRIDELLSNHADTNNYFGNPILFGKSNGGTLSLPQKSDAGKYVEGTGTDTDLKFVTWNNAPESVKMEIENLLKVINSLSNTPDISFENMKGLGPMSCFAIQLMFLGATLKAKDCQMSIFGEGVQRAYNYMKKLVSVLDKKFVTTLSFPIKPTFASVLPNNDTETLENINKAIDKGYLSNETAVELNPLVDDNDTEKDRLKAEKEEKQAVDLEKAQATANNMIPVKQNGQGLQAVVN